MKNEKRTIGETARFFNVTTVTIRNWVSLLGDRFLSAESTRKTGKRFSPGDISTLQKLQSLLSEGVTYEHVLERLPTIPEIVENTTETTEEEPLPPGGSAIQTLQLFEKFQAIMKLQAEQFNVTLQAKDETITTLKDENTRLHEEINQLKTPWYKKLFKGG